MFAYCANNPVNTIDPTGEFGILAAILIGAAVGLASQYAKDVVENYNDGKTGLEMLEPHSPLKDYLGSAVAGGVAAIPYGGLAGSFAWEALGNVLGEGIKGNISSVDEGIAYAVEGGGANFIASVASRILVAGKVVEIDNLSRFDRKRLFEVIIPTGEQAGWNGNLRAWSEAPFNQKMAWAGNVPGFAIKAALFSAIISSGIIEATK